MTIAVLVAVATALTFLAYRRRRPARIAFGRYSLLLGGLAAYTLFQLVPLPMALLRLLAPATAEVLRISLPSTGHVPGWHAISLAPVATLWEGLKLGACLLAFIVAKNMLREQRRRERLLQTFVAVGVVLTGVGIVGTIVAPGKPLLFYLPQNGSVVGMMATSFVNPNHGAAFLLLCALAAVGLAVASTSVANRLMLMLSAAFIGTGLCFTLSRGGMVALAVGMMVFGGLLTGRKDHERNPIALVPLTAGLVLGLAGWLAYDSIVGEFRRHVEGVSFEKLSLWPAGWAMAKTNAIVGVGRGAFLTTFPRYLDSHHTSGTYAYLENQYLHLPAEWGFPVAALAILGSAAALVMWIRRNRDDILMLAMSAALIALAAHNLVDFNFEVLGITLPVAVICGMLAAREPRPTKSHRGNRVLVIAALAPLPLLLVASSLGSTDDLLVHAQEQWKHKAPATEIKTTLQRAMSRRPADYVPHVAAARLALAQRDPSALKELNRAMLLYPASPELHRQAAEVLLRLGHRRQALLEYRLALAGLPSGGQILRDALHACKNIEDLEALLPRKRSDLHADAARWLVEEKRFALARSMLERSRLAFPTDPTLAKAEVETLIAMKQYADAEPLARSLAHSQPIPEHFQLWAKAAAETNPSAAVRILREAVQRFPLDAQCRLDLGRALLRAKRYEEAAQLASDLIGELDDTKALAAAHELLAGVHYAQGKTHRAQFERRQAQQIRALGAP